MKKLVSSALMIGLVLAASGLLLAHPHFDKNIVAKLPTGVQVTIAYNTTPSNEALATGAAAGQFVTPRAPQITLSTEVKSGTVTIPAGQYTLGVIKNSDTDWTMALFPGRTPRQMAEADLAKLIKLDSMFDANAGVADHMLIDITPGHGKFLGKAVLTLHFGKLFLAGALS